MKIYICISDIWGGPDSFGAEWKMMSHWPLSAFPHRLVTQNPTAVTLFFPPPEQTLILFWKVNDTVNLIGHFSAIMWILKSHVTSQGTICGVRCCLMAGVGGCNEARGTEAASVWNSFSNHSYLQTNSESLLMVIACSFSSVCFNKLGNMRWCRTWGHSLFCINSAVTQSLLEQHWPQIFCGDENVL